MEPSPLLFGRLLRILSGLGLLGWLVISPLSWFPWRLLLLFLGVSLVIGGVMAYPGCEIMALPNLLLRRRMHCY
jgi:hypothetical protein